MAGSRKPGPQCSHNDRVNVDDGTMCRAQSPTPGPLGTTSGLLANIEGGEYVSRAFARAAQLAPAALYQEIGRASGEALEGMIPDLIKVLKLQTASTARGAMSSAFANALPWAGTDRSRDILTSLGLEFLPESIDGSLGEMTRFLQSGVSVASNAGEHRGGGRDQEVERAAEELALATGILGRAILRGIVEYLENGSRAPRRGSVASGHAVGTPETALPTDAAVAQLVAHLRSCKLENGFAIWVERNWKELLKNLRLRIRPRMGGGSVAAELGRVSSGRTPRVPLAQFSQPESDPSTFSSDVRLAAQAATLVAAAAQGTPFCPV